MGLLVAFALLAACQSPTIPAGGHPALDPGQTRLVVQTAAGRALNLLAADYLTLQLISSDGRDVRFAASGGGGTGTYSLVLSGLTSGDWDLQVRLYPSASSTSLLFYANLSHYIEAGRSNTVAVDLYPAGTIDGLAVAEGILPVDLTVSDLEAGPWSTYGAHPLAVGRSLQLRAEAQGPSSVPASDQRVFWSSDDETVLEVTSTGLLTGLRPGTAFLTATTVVGKVSARYQVVVDLSLVGTWEADVETAQGLVVRKAMLQIQRSTKGLQATLWTGLNEGTRFNAHREEEGPLYPAGRSTYLFSRPQVAVSSGDAQWSDLPLYRDTEPAVITVLGADLLGFVGNNRSTGNSPVAWEFRRSALRIDSFETPLANVSVEQAAVGQSLDLSLWGKDWSGYYSPGASNLLWSSSDPAVATVDPSTGEVAFLSTGSVSIRAQGTDAPARQYKARFEVQAAFAYSPLPAGSTEDDQGAFTHVAADTLSGVGGWIVSGRATDSAFLTRYRANGAPDAAFGGNSSSLLPLAGLNQIGMIQAQRGTSTSPGSVQWGGQIHWLVPSVEGGSEITPNYRFSSVGLLDATYADMDTLDQEFNDFRAVGAPAVDSQGNFFVLGIRTTDGVTVIKKLPSNGVVTDSTSESNDFWVSPFSATAFVGARIQVAPDDKILIVANSSGGGDGRILRLTPGGTLDLSFGTNGEHYYFEPGGGAHTDLRYASLRVVGGYLYVTGSRWFYTSDPRYPWQYSGFVVRLSLDGAFDPTFARGGNHGYYNNPSAPHFVLHKPYEVPLDLEVDSQGRIVVVGRSYAGKAFATRLLTDATGIDLDFGASHRFGDGVILDQGTTSAALSVAIDAQNRIAVAGNLEGTYPALWRFE